METKAIENQLNLNKTENLIEYKKKGVASICFSIVHYHTEITKAMKILKQTKIKSTYVNTSTNYQFSIPFGRKYTEKDTAMIIYQ